MATTGMVWPGTVMRIKDAGLESR